MRYKDEGYAEPLTTDQCNGFLRLSVAEMVDNGAYPEAELSNTMLLSHMADTQQPAPDMTSFALVLDSMLLSLSQHDGDVHEPASMLLLSLYSSFLPLLHTQFSTSAATCAVYTQAMAAFRRIHDMPAAFQVFLLMAQNKVDGLTPECCEEVLEVLAADTGGALWDYAEQHFGEAFVEMLAVEQPSEESVVPLPLHKSLPMLTLWTSPDGSMQRLSVCNGPTPAWMIPTWQSFQPYDAAAHASLSSMDASPVAAEASNEQDGDSADALQPSDASGSSFDPEVLHSNHSRALQDLLAMPKSKVSRIMRLTCVASNACWIALSCIIILYLGIHRNWWSLYSAPLRVVHVQTYHKAYACEHVHGPPA